MERCKHGEETEKPALMENAHDEKATDVRTENSRTYAQRQNLRKYFLGTFGAFGYCFATVGGIACIQAMNQVPPNFQLNSLRFIVGFIFISICLLVTRKNPKLQKGNAKWVICVTVATVLYNFALYTHYLRQLTLVSVLSMFVCFALVFISILAKIFLKTKLSAVKGGLIVVTLIGLLLVLSSQYIETKGSTTNLPFEKSSEEHNQTGTVTKGTNVTGTFLQDTEGCSRDHDNCNQNLTDILIAAGCIVVATLMATLDSTIVAGTGLKIENIFCIAFWYCIPGIVLSLILTFSIEDPFIPDSTMDILLCFGHSISASSITFFDLLAIQNIDVRVFYVVGSFRLPLCLVTQVTVLKHVTPNANMWLLVSGMVIIFICSISISLYEYLMVKKHIGDDKNECEKAADNKESGKLIDKPCNSVL